MIVVWVGEITGNDAVKFGTYFGDRNHITF